MCQLLRDLREVVLDSMDVTLFRNGRYTLLCVSNFLLNSCVDNPYVYIPDSAITLGVDKERASFLISFIGILNTLGVVRPSSLPAAAQRWWGGRTVHSYGE